MEEDGRLLFIRALYKNLGGNPNSLTIGPSTGFLGMNYTVTKDRKEETILRREIDAGDFAALEVRLKRLLDSPYSAPES